jgi:hypothetical protein
MRVEVDGDKGYVARMGNSALELKKGPRRVSMPFSEITSVSRGKRYRYGKPVLWMGILLLPVLGVGAILVALYLVSGYDVLVICYRRRKYALSGKGAALRRIGEALKRRRPDIDASAEE